MRAKEFTKTNSYSDSQNSNIEEAGYNSADPSTHFMKKKEIKDWVITWTNKNGRSMTTELTASHAKARQFVASLETSNATNINARVKKIEEMTEGPTSNADDIIANYNHENMMAGGSEAHLTGSDTVTVLSLDDFEDMFIGSVAEFEAWANSMSEGSGDSTKTQIDMWSNKMQQASKAGDEKAYRYAESKLNAISDAIQANRDWNARPEVSGIQDRGGYETMTMKMDEDERDFDDGKVKVKFGKSKPFKAPSFNDSMTSFIDQDRSSSRQRDVDDGSRGLSNRDRNK